MKRSSMDDGYHCDTCNKYFTNRRNMLRHVNSVHAEKRHKCSDCSEVFSRGDSLKRHRRKHDEDELKDLPPAKTRKTSHLAVLSETAKTVNGITGKCICCAQNIHLLPNKKFCAPCGEKGRECKTCHQPVYERMYSEKTDKCDRCILAAGQKLGAGGSKIQALKGAARLETIEPNTKNFLDIFQFFGDNKALIEVIHSDRLLNVKGMKWFMTLYIKFVKYIQNNEASYAEPAFRSNTVACTNLFQIKEQIAEAFEDLHNEYQNFERNGSGWSIDKIIKLEISSTEYRPLEGSSYIPLPAKIQKKKAVLNIKNNDQKCFMWSILGHLHPITSKNSPNRVSKYVQYKHELNTAGVIEFPTPLSQIPKFEKCNNISINVFGLEDDEVYPLQITKFRDMPKERHVNLLLFSKGELRHYTLIKKLSRLLGDRTKHKAQSFYCNFCLHGFSSKRCLKNHIEHCSPNGTQKTCFPKTEDQKWVHFNHIQKQLAVPFVIYADLESFIEPISTCQPGPSTSFTQAYQKHKPSGFCYLVKCTSNGLSKPAYVYKGENVIDTFYDCLFEEEQEICDILNNPKPQKLSKADKKSFEKATNCHICKKDLGTDKVRDHNHLPPYSYRGAAHRHCNLQFQFRRGKRKKNFKFYIPVVIHNLKGYDSHLLMESVGKKSKDRHLSVIPYHSEKYLSFSVGSLRFIDSLQFLNESLDKLVTNLSKEDESKFETLASHFPNNNEFKLLVRKGVYPYEFVSSQEKFKQTSLPPKSAFYSKLSDSEISDKDYEHAQTVWKTFKMNNFGEYHDLYLKTDVILLTDVFENFRKMCQTNYHLDPAHYYSSPGFAWDAMLKMTKTKLRLIDDIDMVLMIEKGKRGGISMICKKLAKANNPLVTGFDPSEPKNWLAYLDMNNLYGAAQAQKLPEKDFYWLSEDEINQLDIRSIADDSDTGYILEVDLDYPPRLHDKHNDYPMAVESINVTEQMLSTYTDKLGKDLKLEHKTSKKLVPNLNPKEKYVLHYRNLKQYILHGLELRKIHRVIGFKQSFWLKPYIDFNTEKRKHAQNGFEKNFFKLMNNSVFGKTMENLRTHAHVELVNSPKKLRKLCAKPNFQNFTIFNEDLVAVNLKKVKIVLNRPTYAGVCILDISKTFMYEFHYDYIQKKYGSKAHLLFTDTDSLCYEIETEDLYQDMWKDKQHFDLSNYEQSHEIFDNTNHMVLGKMKDECKGTPIEEFVGLRPKMYSLKYGSQEKKTAKGVKNCVREKHLKHETYFSCLWNKCCSLHKMNMFRSYNHDIYSVTVNKTSLSPYDDKRYFLKDGINSWAYGHKSIPES